MSRDANGTYSLPAGNPVVTLEVISSTWANTTLSDLASAMTDSLSRTGLGGMTSALKLANGAVGTPSLTFGTETTLGAYRAAAGDLRFAVGGSDTLRITSTILSYGGNVVPTVASTGVTFTGANTYSGINTFSVGQLFTANSSVSGSVAAISILGSTVGAFEIGSSGAAANTGKWHIRGSNAGRLSINVVSDDRTTVVEAIGMARSTTTPGLIDITPAVTFAGLGKFTRAVSGGTGTAAGFEQGFYIADMSAAADTRVWDQTVSGAQLRHRAVNDANNVASTWLSIDRTTTTIDAVNFPTDGASENFTVGTDGATTYATLAKIRTTQANKAAAILVNATATSATLTIQNEATAGNNVFISLNTEAGGSITQRGSIDFDRAGVVTRYNTTCDGGLKENVTAAPSALPLLRQIQVRSFRWINEKVVVPFGFIAQEVFPLVPSAVSQGRTGTPWGMDFSKLIPLHTKALQELDARLTAAGF